MEVTFALEVRGVSNNRPDGRRKEFMRDIDMPAVPREDDYVFPTDETEVTRVVRVTWDLELGCSKHLHRAGPPSVMVHLMTIDSEDYDELCADLEATGWDAENKTAN